MSYGRILDELPQYSEATVGRVLDYELDWGTIKPAVVIEGVPMRGAEIKVSRAFCRGEYGPWFEWEADLHTYEDGLIVKTLGLAPTLMQQFLDRLHAKEMTGTQFAKLFSNLCHDWPTHFGKLYLGWRAYKYGAIPIVPRTTGSGEYQPLDRFLAEVGALSEVRHQRGRQLVRGYGPADGSTVPWKTIYEKTTDGMEKAVVSGLARLYAAIQAGCTTSRPAGPRTTTLAVFQDPLVVLASARDERTAYRCGWFEVNDWREKGLILFSVLQAKALDQNQPSGSTLEPLLEEFAAPARLLFDKVEMYRNLPYLREQIATLAASGDFDFAQAVLDTIDEQPTITGHSPHPVGNLEWAAGMMRPFSSMVRQVLTMCKLDTDDRAEADKVDENGLPKDAAFYLREFLAGCPEARALEGVLTDCIAEARQGRLTPRVAKCLTRVFRLVIQLFDSGHRIPDPRQANERLRQHREWWDGLVIAFRELQMPDPYVVVAADIYNLRHLPGIAEVLGLDPDLALSGLMKWVETNARKVMERHPKVKLAALSGDRVILAAHEADRVMDATVELLRESAARVATHERRLAELGLLRVGMAWHEDAEGDQFKGVQPGWIAYTVGDRSGVEPGTIRITEAVRDRLSPEYQQEFVATEERSGQGIVFARQWVLARDSR